MTTTEQTADDRIAARKRDATVRKLVAAKERMEKADATLTEARAALGAAILAARADGMTVPQVADALDWSEANVFRVSAQAKKAAGS